ncbi:MAG: hypothetical protein Ct9H300mP1_23940 [Planctomycetaceae bacterium]|nr:MAG: hypothetical protein Ct9H300mP1_23940 [Planctomycetaceae bacterium]
MSTTKAYSRSRRMFLASLLGTAGGTAGLCALWPTTRQGRAERSLRGGNAPEEGSSRCSERGEIRITSLKP